MPSPPHPTTAQWAHAVASGQGVVDIRQRLDQGHDPFLNPDQPDGHSVFFHLVARREVPADALIDHILARPEASTWSTPESVAAGRHVINRIRAGTPAPDITRLYDCFIALGTQLPALETLARQALVNELAAGANQASPSGWGVAAALALAPLPAGDVAQVWPSRSRGWDQLRVVLEQVPAAERLDALKQAFLGTPAWGNDVLQALLPTTRTREVLVYLQQWAGPEGHQWLADHAPHLVVLALNHGPTRIRQWLGVLAPRNHAPVWQAVRAAGVDPWALLFARPVGNGGLIRFIDIVPRLAEGLRWIKSPSMGLEGAWVAWQGLVERVERDHPGALGRGQLVELRAMGNALADAGATLPGMLPRFQPTASPAPWVQALDAKALSVHMDQAMAPATSAPRPRRM